MGYWRKINCTCLREYFGEFNSTISLEKTILMYQNGRLEVQTWASLKIHGTLWLNQRLVNCAPLCCRGAKLRRFFVHNSADFLETISHKHVKLKVRIHDLIVVDVLFSYWVFREISIETIEPLFRRLNHTSYINVSLSVM